MNYRLPFFIGFVMMGSTLAIASELAVIGDERAVATHLNQTQAAELSTRDLVAHGEILFNAKFTVLDGAGRPGATQAEVPTMRELHGTSAFFRTSGPDANACNGCHNQPESGGAGEFVANVFASEGISHAEFDTLDAQADVIEFLKSLQLVGRGSR